MSRCFDGFQGRVSFTSRLIFDLGTSSVSSAAGLATPPGDWLEVVTAASHACRTPDIGRKLYGLVSRAGFSNVKVELIKRVDTDGRLLGVVENLAGYAKVSGRLSEAAVDDVVGSVRDAIDAGTYLALAPQFVVIATR